MVSNLKYNTGQQVLGFDLLREHVLALTEVRDLWSAKLGSEVPDSPRCVQETSSQHLIQCNHQNEGITS